MSERRRHLSSRQVAAILERIRHANGGPEPEAIEEEIHHEPEKSDCVDPCDTGEDPDMLSDSHWFWVSSGL
jgi:hypothetical protein